MSTHQPPPRPSALRAARTERGWSQSGAAARLRELSAQRGGAVPSATSLKTQLSRWENGHALPEPGQRQLLVELYGRPADALGLAPRTSGGSPRQQLLSELAAAAAADDAVVEHWWVQVTAAVRLDDELGAAGAADVTAGLVAQLSRTLAHTLGTVRRAVVARPLAVAAALAARHALDRDDPATAWARYDTAAGAAAVAGSSVAAAAATAGRADVLRGLGDAAAAERVLAESLHDPGHPDGPATARLAGARAVTWAELGRAADARRAADDAHAALATGREPPGAGGADVRAPDGHERDGHGSDDRRLDVPRPDDRRPDVRHPDDLFPVELADVHRWHGQALARLHDGAAADLLSAALAAGPRSARHRAELHAELAAVHRSAGRAAAAAEHAERARRLAERIGSTALLRDTRRGVPERAP